jgi:hypothetical protein
MQVEIGISYGIGFFVGLLAALWPFLLIGLAAFIAFKYWKKRNGKAVS